MGTARLAQEGEKPLYFKVLTAGGLVLLATGLRLLFLEELGTYYPFVVFYPAVLLAAHYGGLWCGLSATFFSLMPGIYFWFDPARLPAGHWPDWLRMALFLFFGCISSILVEGVQRRMARAYRGKQQAEEALSTASRSLELERDILHAVMDGAKNSHLAYLDADFNFVRVNETYARTCGYKPEEMIGKNHFELYPDDENEAIFTRARDTGEGAECLDKSFVFPDQPERGVTYWDWTLAPVKDESARVVGLVFSLFETTRRKQAEEALRESEDRFRAAFENSAVPMAMSTLDGRMRKVNGAFSLMLGYDEGELDGRRYTEVTHPDDLQENLAEVPRLIDGRIRSLRMDKRYFTKSGEIVWGDMSATCIRNAQGQPLYLLAHIQDITCRKRAEAKLQELNEALELRVKERTEELRQKDHILIQQSRLAAMGEMINNIAHQWRQPLNALGLNVQQLKLFGDGGGLTQDLLDSGVENAMMLVRHMSATIDDFREFFRPDKAQEEFQVKEVVKGAIKLVEASFRNQEIVIVMQSDDDPVVLGYPNQYAQVVLNLLANARDAFEISSRSNGRIELNLCKRDGRSLLTVTDNAGGIAAGIIDRIFDPHFTTKAKNGTGIGLFMAKNIIERHMHGNLSVMNMGEGAQFTIEV